MHCTPLFCCCLFFFFNDTATTEIYTLSLHDALPISLLLAVNPAVPATNVKELIAWIKAISSLTLVAGRSEEHTSELQSLAYLVCRLLLEKKNTKTRNSENSAHAVVDGD